MSQRTEWLLLLLLSVLGFCIRSVGLADFAVTHWDEGAIWSGARWFLTLTEAGGYHPENSPPLPPLLFAIGASLLGGAPADAVWISVLSGTASIILIYRAVKRLLDVNAAFAAAWLFASSGLHVMYSRSLLTEPLYIFFLLLTLLGSIEYLCSRDVRWLLFTIAGAVALQFTKYNGCLAAGPLLAVLAFEVLRESDVQKKRRSLIHGLMLGGSVAFAITINVLLLSQITDLARFYEYYAYYVGRSNPSASLIAEYMDMVTRFPVLYLAILGVVYSLWRHRSQPWIIIHAGCLLYTLFLLNYTFYLRLLAPVSIFVIVYASAGLYGVLQWSSKTARRPLLAVLACLIIVDTWRELPRYIQRDHSGYVRASAYINGISADIPVVLMTQRNVWTEINRPVVRFALRNTERILRTLSPSGEAFVVTDIFAYNKYSAPIPPVLLRRLMKDHVVARISNPLAYEVVENNLTVSDLKRLEHDQALRARIFAIYVLRVDRDELRSMLARSHL